MKKTKSIEIRIRELFQELQKTKNPSVTFIVSYAYADNENEFVNKGKIKGELLYQGSLEQLETLCDGIKQRAKNTAKELQGIELEDNKEEGQDTLRRRIVTTNLKI